MDLPVSFFLVAAFAVLVTGISKSGFGGGLGVMAVPLMSLYISPQLAVAVLMPILLAMDLLIVWQYRHRWSKPVVATLLPGAIAGLTLGAMVFQWMSADFIRLFVGVLALLLVAQFMLGPRHGSPRRKPRFSGVFLLGSLSGFASFVAHAGGPPVKGFLLRQGMEKSVFVGTNTMFFFAMNATKSVAYSAMGQLTEESLSISLMLAPLVLVGVWGGTVLHRVISADLFVGIVYAFLFCAGLKLLWDGSAAVMA
ncbi:sulfite exporter TauE/SafE family protein [Roseobacter weihaiensis]|uniref:sulfite exporter TauE/SafE family protein n=1 Tax=Roseobacter weihaiensis TaxID=2763262 RepID=UPI001D09F90B|nr:sulfite exporter TauE/SafE family protein [Roseobacter sp. H9]